MRIPKVQKIVKILVSFCAFGICARKNYWWNVGEIKPRRQFNQHFTSSFLEQKCFVQLFSNYSLVLYFFGEVILKYKRLGLVLQVIFGYVKLIPRWKLCHFFRFSFLWNNFAQRCPNGFCVTFMRNRISARKHINA